MTNRRLQSLMEASKRGLTLCYDPPTVSNRCFYRCLAKSLKIAEDDVVEMLESYMISNRVISCTNKVSILLVWNIGPFLITVATVFSITVLFLFSLVLSCLACFVYALHVLLMPRTFCSSLACLPCMPRCLAGSHIVYTLYGVIYKIYTHLIAPF